MRKLTFTIFALILTFVIAVLGKSYSSCPKNLASCGSDKRDSCSIKKNEASEDEKAPSETLASDLDPA
jgi:hypothetical protein